MQNVVRSEIFPLLRQAPDAPAEAGVHQAKAADLEEVHRKVLFSGQLETCDGTTATHDTLLLTVTQIGVCLISYQGDELALSQRLYRRDLRTVGTDPIDEARELLGRRKDRAATGVADKRDTLSELARRGIMTYAERATLLQRSDAAWRMGHGNIAPYELLTGSGNMALLAASLKVLRNLVAYRSVRLCALLDQGPTLANDRPCPRAVGVCRDPDCRPGNAPNRRRRALQPGVQPPGRGLRQ